MSKCFICQKRLGFMDIQYLPLDSNDSDVVCQNCNERFTKASDVLESISSAEDITAKQEEALSCFSDLTLI